MGLAQRNWIVLIASVVSTYSPPPITDYQPTLSVYSLPPITDHRLPTHSFGVLHPTDYRSPITLYLTQSLIKSITLIKLRMRSSFDDLAMANNNNFISMLDGTQPVRNNDRSPVLHEINQCLLHQFFRF